MKKIISKYKGSITFILLMTGIFAPLQRSDAQNISQPMPCGGYTIDVAARRKVKEFALNNNHPVQTLTPYLVRVYFHILRETNGTNPCATETQVTNEFNALSADYAANNICFLNAGWDYVNNSQLDTNYNPYSNPLGTLFDPYKAPGCINVFYLQQILGANSSGGGIGGFTFFSPWDVCIVSSGNLGIGQTTSHEVGHCLGLWHTYDHSFGYENIDGTFSTTTGDFISDTPADPYSHKTDTIPSCFSTTGCLYTGSCTDPNLQSNYTPPYTNLMAYWWSIGIGCYPNLGLTLGQYASVGYYLNTTPQLVACESPHYYTQMPVNITSGYLMDSAIDTLRTSGNVNLSGTAIATLGGGTVLIESGFHAYPSAGGKVLIRSAGCSFVPRYEGTPNTAAINKNKPVGLTCIPNPSNGYVTISYQLPIDGEASINLLDITGRTVKEIQVRTLFLGGLHENTVDVGTMNNGIYFVRMTYNGKNSIAKLVVAH
jgi:hypothetical protein